MLQCCSIFEERKSHYVSKKFVYRRNLKNNFIFLINVLQQIGAKDVRRNDRRHIYPFYPKSGFQCYGLPMTESREDKDGGGSNCENWIAVRLLADRKWGGRPSCLILYTLFPIHNHSFSHSKNTRYTWHHHGNCVSLALYENVHSRPCINKKLRGLSPWANCADRATAACRRS
jgi:hypothetical protein